MAKVTPFEKIEEQRRSPSDSPAPVLVPVVPHPHGVSGHRGSGESSTVDRTAHAPEHHSAIYVARHFVKHSGWHDSPTARSMRSFLRGRFFTFWAVIALFLALFLSEIFSLFQVPSNTELDIILTLVFVLFFVEFAGLTLTDASYLFSFFFWMDLLGTLSMIMDISYLAEGIGIDVDVTKARVLEGGGQSSNNNVIVVRAVRAAKLGARAGRLGRGVRILLPFLHGKSEEEQQKVKMAKVISTQLTNVLSTRVAFLTICIVVMLPLFTLFMYPTADDSVDVWTKLLNRNAELYLAESDPVAAAAMKTIIEAELKRFIGFYGSMDYGPFSVCIGHSLDSGFVCDPLISLAFPTTFQEPARKKSIVEVNHPRFQANFDMVTPRQAEAAASIALLTFVILVMCCFGLLMSSSISVIALQPLERMLSVVREHCTEIFKYTKELQDEDADDDDLEYDDMDTTSEFMILEKLVGKLTGIVNLATAHQEPEVHEDMNENDIMALNFMQGAQVPAAAIIHVRNSARVSRNQVSADEVNTPRDDRMHSCIHSNIPNEVIEAIETPYFNSLELTKELRMAVCAHIVLSSDGSCIWVRANVQESHLVKFISVCESKYPPNPFHNFGHGVDVLYSVSRFMRQFEAYRFLPDTSQFWIMIASIAHDVGHMGVNNQYLVETAHELAVRYNDRSPLENMHCASLFQVVGDPEANIFAKVEKDLYKEMRKGIINAILHTDVVKHNDMIKELSLLYQMNSDSFDAMEPAQAVTASQNNIQCVLNAILHTADIANPMKPWELARRLAYLCVDEFFAQGDMEKALSIPVQMLNDRDKVSRPNSQLGFLEFVILPLVEVMVNLFPQLDSLAENLGSNLAHWSEVWAEEANPTEEAIVKVKARVQKANHRCRAVMRHERGFA